MAGRRKGGARPQEIKLKMKGKGKKVGRPYWSLPVARRVVPSEIWCCETETCQDGLDSSRSAPWMAVAVVETFDRLHPLAAPRDANAVAVRFALPSPWKIARVVRSEERRVGKEWRSRRSPYH